MAPNATKKDKPAPMPMSQAIRQAGEGGITKQEIKQIAGDKSTGSVIQKLDQINKNIRQNDGVGINLNSGAANMLIRQAGKEYQSPTSMDSLMSKLRGESMFGPGRIGSVLQARALGTDLLGRPGNTMLGGTTIRSGGGEANKGVGKQYTYSGGKGPYNDMELGPFNPNGPGPLAKPNTSTWLGNENLGATGGDTTITTETDTTTAKSPEEIAQSTMDPAFSDYGDRYNLSNAFSFRTQRKGKRMGIGSTRAASRSARSGPSSKTLGI